MNFQEIMTKLEEKEAKNLVILATNYLFSQPIVELFPARFVTSQVQLFLQSVVEGQQTQAWVTEQIEQLRTQVPKGYPKDIIPDQVIEPWKKLLGQELSLDEKLIHHLLDHKAIESLFHEILTDVLTEFTQTIKNWSDFAAASSPKGMSKGFGRLRALGERALKETPLGSFTQMIEQQAQRKILEYLDRSISTIIKMSAGHVCDEHNRKLQAAYRIHVLDVLLHTRNETLLKQVEEIEVEAVIQTITKTIDALLSQDTFQDDIHKLVLSILDSFDQKSLFDVMKEAGIDDSWRAETEDHLSMLLLGFLKTEPAQQWLENLLFAKK